jgi:hypothetical protein
MMSGMGERDVSDFIVAVLLSVWGAGCCCGAGGSDSASSPSPEPTSASSEATSDPTTPSVVGTRGTGAPVGKRPTTPSTTSTTSTTSTASPVVPRPTGGTVSAIPDGGERLYNGCRHNEDCPSGQRCCVHTIRQNYCASDCSGLSKTCSTDAECPAWNGSPGYCRRVLHMRCVYDDCTRDSQCDAARDGGKPRCMTKSHPYHCEGSGPAMHY